jgi:DNA modification methylase
MELEQNNKIDQSKEDLSVSYIPLSSLRNPERNPRKWTKEATEQLKESIKRYGIVDPFVVNSAENRKNIILGGNFRAKVLKEMGYEEVPVVFVNIPDPKKEEELIIRLNKNCGEFDIDLLAEFDETLLADIGFSSEELDSIFPEDENPEVFDLDKELKEMKIESITVQNGDVYELNGSRLMCGDSTIEADMVKLMGSVKADMCLTDPPYILNYLKGKKKKPSTEGFGYKRDRHYLGTDELPPDFTQNWMANVSKIAKPDFSIIVYENWKNIRTIWNEMEKYWKVKNMIVWHLPNRVQGFASKNHFFNKHDIAMVGASEAITPNEEDETEELLQNDYEAALYAISGKPHWESYEKGKKYCPTDFIEFNAADEKSSGQGIIFGTKPIEILIPYIKVLTKRDDLIVEPFGGSGSTLIAAIKMKRHCYLMEKSNVYAQVILKRWENETGEKPAKIL